MGRRKQQALDDSTLDGLPESPNEIDAELATRKTHRRQARRNRAAKRNAGTKLAADSQTLPEFGMDDQVDQVDATAQLFDAGSIADGLLEAPSKIDAPHIRTKKKRRRRAKQNVAKKPRAFSIPLTNDGQPKFSSMRGRSFQTLVDAIARKPGGDSEKKLVALLRKHYPELTSTQKKLVDTILIPPQASTSTGAGGQVDTAPPKIGPVTAGHINAILTIDELVMRWAVPSLVKQQTQGKMDIDPHLADQVFRFTAEHRAYLCPLGAKFFNENLPDGALRWMEKHGPMLEVVSSLALITLEWTRAYTAAVVAAEALKEKQKQTATAPANPTKAEGPAQTPASIDSQPQPANGQVTVDGQTSKASTEAPAKPEGPVRISIPLGPIPEASTAAPATKSPLSGLTVGAQREPSTKIPGD